MLPPLPRSTRTSLLFPFTAFFRSDFLFPVVVSACTGFSFPLVLSVCYGALISKRPILMWGASFGLLIVATSLWAFIDASVIQFVNANSESGFTGLLLGALYIDATTLAAWWALAFAIN